jgi:hypothetical protein
MRFPEICPQQGIEQRVEPGRYPVEGPKQGKVTRVTTVIERIEGHYEVCSTSYGQAYVWRPERIVVACECGQRLALSGSEPICSCGVNHAPLLREQLASRKVSEGAHHLWEAEFKEWRAKQDEYIHSEETYWLELNAIDSPET